MTALRKIAAVSLLILLFAGRGWAVTYYVSNSTGSDANTSTQAQSALTPWKNHPDSSLASGSSSAIRASLQPGDVIVMARGDIWANTQMVTCASGSSVTGQITTTSLSGFGSGSALPVISGALPLGGTWTDSGTNGEYYIALTTQPRVVYNASTLLSKGSAVGALTANQFIWSSGNLYVKIGSDPTGGSIEASQTHPLRILHSYRTYSNLDLRYSNDETAGAIYAVSVTKPVIDGCYVSRCLTYASRFYATTSLELRNSNISHLTMPGITKTPIAVYLSNGGTGALVTDNTLVSDITGIVVGVSLQNGGSSTVSSNRIQDTHKGIEIASCDSNYVHSNNLVSNWNRLEYGAGGMGIDIEVSGSSSNNRVIGNYLYNGYVSMNIIETAGAGNNLIAYNILEDYHVNGISLGTGGTATAASPIYNNTIIHNPTAGSPSGSVGHGISVNSSATHAYQCKFATIKNNLFVGMTAGAEMLEIDTEVSSATTTMDVDYNCYYQLNPGAAWRFTDQGEETTDFAAWKTLLSSGGVSGADAHSKNVNPKFRSATDFHLRSSSPCINAGVHIPGLETDFDGRDVKNLPDIGVYEFYPKPSIFTPIFSEVTQ